MRFCFIWIFILGVIGCQTFSLSAQNDLAIGQWTQHLPFQESQYVTGGKGDIYYSTGTAIAIVHDDQSVDYLSKVNGLSGVDIEAIHYNQFLDVLIIGYTDGNIDLVYEDGIVNKNEILLNSNIQANRAIKSIYVDDTGVVYMSTDFGLVIMDIDQNEFETVDTPSPVNQSVIFENNLYVSTDDGIYRITRNQNVNFIDFNLWDFYGPDFGLPSIYGSQGIVSFNNNLYADINGDLYRIDGLPRLLIDEADNVDVHFLYAGRSKLFAGFICLNSDQSECEGVVYSVDSSDRLTRSNPSCARRPRAVYEDDQGVIWFADQFDILAHTSDLSVQCVSENLNTPSTSDVQDVKVVDEILYVAVGGARVGFTPNSIQTGTSVLKDGQWSDYGNFSGVTPTRDHYKIVPHPEDNRVFIATISSGVIEHDPVEFTFLTYNETNSPLRSALGDVEDVIRTISIDFDSEQNLWVTNYTAPSPLHVLRTDGTWQSFNPNSFDQYTHMIVDQSDNKWIVTGDQGISITLFNEGESTSISDDRVRELTMFNTELQSSEVLSMAVDRNGAVWVGTEQGVVVFNCGDPFDVDCTGSRPKVLKDDFLAFLLENETVNTIAVDPANRKWFGTNNGIFVQSPSGEEEIFQFSEKNSPLFTNRIVELDVDPKTGVVYIGTERGLMAYKSESIEGSERHSADIRSYPNPVEPGYEGTIAIVGLANESSVKIANIHGQLVYETEALGGQAIWDGRDFSGRKVSSGVYYVFGATNSFFGDADGALTKILILN